jgi:hypothetical protein
MKTMVLAAFAALSLGAGVANAQPVSHSTPLPHGTQYNWMAGGGG